MNNVQVPSSGSISGNRTRPNAAVGRSSNQSRVQLQHQSSSRSSVSHSSSDEQSRISQRSTDPTTASSITASNGDNNNRNSRMELASHRHHNAMYAHAHAQHQPQYRQETGGNYTLPLHGTLNQQLLHQQQHHQQQHAPSSRSQASPTVYSRSSPIAIIRNPEDGVEQAKLRWQHPMYDTSDDEMDDDDFQHQSGVAVESLTACAKSSRSGPPQSLPTALLRAPKLGSLPAQQNRLLQFATLPPPMCLNGALDIATTTDTLHTPPQHTRSQSYGGKPKYLSSYGSLRDSHLTGRFGGLAENQETRFEPPATLIPPPTTTIMFQPHNPSLTTTTSPMQLLPETQTPNTNDSPKPALSIRDRMIQKAQQKESEQLQQNEPSETSTTTSKAPSSLSALLEASEQDYKAERPTTIRQITEHEPIQQESQNSLLEHTIGALHRSSLGPGVLPPGVARAFAISYNSNLQMFASNPQNSQQHPQQEYYRSSSSAILSSSMTGLEILRSSAKLKPPSRPTSLRILQDSSQSPLQIMQTTFPATLTVSDQEQPFQPLARTMSEPCPHWEQQSLHQSSMSQPTTSSTATPAHLRTPLDAQESHPAAFQTRAATTPYKHYPHGLVRMNNGRILIPPKNINRTANYHNLLHATPVVLPLGENAQGRQHPNTETASSNLQHSLNAWGASVANTTASATAPSAASPATTTTAASGGAHRTFASEPYHGGNNNPPYGTHAGDEEPNPDTQGAFDMDLE